MIGRTVDQGAGMAGVERNRVHASLPLCSTEAVHLLEGNAARQLADALQFLLTENPPADASRIRCRTEGLAHEF